VQLDQEHTAGRRCPFDVDDLLGLTQERLGVRAIAPVDGHPVAPRHETEDLVPRHRGAAPRQLHIHVRHALDHDAGVTRTAASGPARRRDRRLGQVLDATLLAPHGSEQPTDHVLGRDVTFADRGIQTVDVDQVQLLGDAGERLDRGQALEGHTLLAHRLGQGLLAVLDHLLAALAGEPLLDLVSGTCRLHEVQPVA